MMAKEERAAYARQYRATHLAAMRASDRRKYIKHKEEMTAWQKQYRAEHKELIAARKAKYDAEHKAERAEYAKKYNAAHRDKLLEGMKVYGAKHKERIAETRAAWYVANKERVRAYKAEHVEEKRLSDSKRRAQKYGNTPVSELLTEAQWRDILDQYHHRCAYCGRKMDKLTMDHVIPLSRGGKHSANNVVPACGHCNFSKSAKTPEEWVGVKVTA